MTTQIQKSPDPLRATYKNRITKNKNITVREGQKQTKLKPLLVTKVCPDLKCTGSWEDIFEIFSVTCKDLRHSPSSYKSDDQYWTNESAHQVSPTQTSILTSVSRQTRNKHTKKK